MICAKRVTKGILSSTGPRAVHFQAVLSRLSGKHRDEFQSIYVQRAGFVYRSITASRLCASGYTKQKACDIGDGYKDAAKHYRDRTAGGEFITSAELSALLPPIVADHLARQSARGPLSGAPRRPRVWEGANKACNGGSRPTASTAQLLRMWGTGGAGVTARPRPR